MFFHAKLTLLQGHSMNHHSTGHGGAIGGQCDNGCIVGALSARVVRPP